MMRGAARSYWSFNVEKFTTTQRLAYKIESASFLKFSDYHRALNTMMSIFFHSKCYNIIREYKNCAFSIDKSVADFKRWVEDRRESDVLFRILYEQIFTYFFSLRTYRKASRMGDTHLADKSFKRFAGSHHNYQRLHLHSSFQIFIDPRITLALS